MATCFQLPVFMKPEKNLGRQVLDSEEKTLDNNSLHLSINV